jgi:hypothetical protein
VFDCIKPYQELGRVPLAGKAKAYLGNGPKGTRHFSSVSSVEAVPAFHNAGFNNKGSRTV